MLEVLHCRIGVLGIQNDALLQGKVLYVWNLSLNLTCSFALGLCFDLGPHPVVVGSYFWLWLRNQFMQTRWTRLGYSSGPCCGMFTLLRFQVTFSIDGSKFWHHFVLTKGYKSRFSLFDYFRCALHLQIVLKGIVSCHKCQLHQKFLLYPINKY